MERRAPAPPPFNGINLLNKIAENRKSIWLRLIWYARLRLTHSHSRSQSIRSLLLFAPENVLIRSTVNIQIGKMTLKSTDLTKDFEQCSDKKKTRERESERRGRQYDYSTIQIHTHTHIHTFIQLHDAVIR